MGLTNFEIILDRHFYHPGENLSGTLVVELKRPKRMRGIYLKYFGQGKVHWRERTGDDSRSYFNKENYLKIRQLTFGNGITECELSAGRHVFVFSHPIPINVPCSYKSACGSIEYFVKATIDRPWKFNHVISQPVTVMSVVDLNYHPDAAMPVMESNCKTFWGHLKPFFMSCHIPNRGFVPGQIIPIQVNMKNTAEIRVKNIVAKLKQTVKYHTRSKSSSRKTTIYKCEHPIQEDFKLKEIVLYIRVPPTTPSYLEYCNIIDIGYYMTVKAIVGGLHKNLKVSTMIIIGNMPLTDDRKVIIGQPPFLNSTIHPI